MDSPLLALTRRGAATLADGTAAENMRQLVQLRWIAVVGQTLAILFVHYGLAVRLPLAQMLGIAGTLGVANLLTTYALSRHEVRSAEVMVALLIDMAVLTLLLYFSGGASNPFISLYLLQVVLGAILLPPAAAALLLGASALAYALLSIRFVPLVLPPTLDPEPLFALGRWIGFVMVATLLVMFSTRISSNLRARDAYLADLRQRAVEEEGIVRMGLFASGAAHELGTPLGTLSVILADWRRVPAIASDPDLSAERAEMEGEVARCKAIVSDILQSAGQPRGEAMERAAPEPFLRAVADAWAPTHPQVPLDYRATGLEGAVLAVEPALRQAIWNLLDNAAAASPAGIALTAGIEDGHVAIAVQDWGDGFAAADLAHVGERMRSSKGPGHGVGLFLAASVARRLGGRLEARNRTGGGAEVRLLLPLAGGGA
ncbi:two-component system, sensor histidine kinase RegB [Sphingomonas guangdongensis]|uniref:histidine kinase n=1 Tax=Sphingomonas guangdongensis TaxID=1141890 RepID=A0A285QHF5_9SPHN|nr:ATP-binding protein [Sphingomonas guangdongensis]SOB80938.1 two-component system, sensor histidine kinase RegB [Sphingomonas guangdongensis]